MRNITAGMVRSFLDEGLTDFFRIETDGVYAKLRANPEQLPQDVLDELTLGLGLEAVHTPLCRLPCSFAELHELAAEFGAPLNWSAIAKDEHGALSCPVDGEEYRRLYGLDALLDYQGLPADPVPLPQWLQAFAGEVARTRGHAPWSDEWIGVLAEVGDLVERHADTFPAVIEPTLRRAPAPIACADAKLRVRPADAAAWIAKHAPTLAAEAGLESSVRANGHQYRQRKQEDEILRVIRELGHDPKALPRAASGKGGVKSEVRARLPNFSASVFDKAWERLRQTGEIADKA